MPGKRSAGVADVGRCKGGAAGLLKDGGVEEAGDSSRDEAEGEGSDGPGAVFGDAAGAAIGAIRRPRWKLFEAGAGGTRFWAATEAAAAAMASAATSDAMATAGAMATARGARADPEANATRATTEPFPGAGPG